MKTYIISGFLGAGKTTLIQKLLNEAFKEERVVVIENDFGAVSIDASVLTASGAEVAAIEGGCVCCNLTEDLKTVLAKVDADIVLIEPSGVSKLSDIEVVVARKITVVSAYHCQMYLDNFGEFFRDQIEHADVIVLSHLSNEEKTRAAIDVVSDINPNAVLITKPWDELDVRDLLKQECAHVHDIFDTLTIRTGHIFTLDEISDAMTRVADYEFGEILRVKGIVSDWNVQFTPGFIHVDEWFTEEMGVVTVIGERLDRQGLEELFHVDSGIRDNGISGCGQNNTAK
jgi:G3E family GTPase